MKKNLKKKYQNIKPDGQAYAELVSEYERDEMSDYSFKSNAQAMGKNARKLKRMKILRIILSIIGAILVLYTGYFIIALIKGINSRTQGTTTEYIEITQDERTTVPDTSMRESTTRQTTVPRTPSTTAAAEQSEVVTEENDL